MKDRQKQPAQQHSPPPPRFLTKRTLTYVGSLLTYTALLVGATWLIATTSFDNRIKSLEVSLVSCKDHLDKTERRARQFIELWETELEQVFLSNFEVLKTHHRNMDRYFLAITRRYPNDRDILQAHSELRDAWEESEKKYANKVEAYKRAKLQWQLAKPPK